MSATERRERERTAQREGIVAAAIAIARKEGWREVTIRKIADAIEYTAPIIYEHFENKDALLLELLRRGFRALNERLRAAIREPSGTRNTILLGAAAAMDFATENPELYQVMHGLDGVPFGTPAAPAEAREAFSILRLAIESWAREQDLKAHSSNDWTETVWALIHGFISLEMAHRLPGGTARVKPLMLKALGSLLSGWETGMRGTVRSKSMSQTPIGRLRRPLGK
ncbi:MAG: TetR/AcrR family transcriptional regulator [Deltaproteobacteria bacterium]|nr:TetR/AcrR family transcriptional regulator [Deltaproteobacteria bacterium]